MQVGRANPELGEAFELVQQLDELLVPLREQLLRHDVDCGEDAADPGASLDDGPRPKQEKVAAAHAWTPRGDADAARSYGRRDGAAFGAAGQRSGDPGYDASVERAIKRVSPLPPPPEAYRKDFSDVELTFRPADLRRPSG